MSLPYIICFCIFEDQVLMVKRDKAPNQDLWNGLGGKIEGKETPEEATIREIYEESGIELTQDLLKFVGLVTWEPIEMKDGRVSEGMYAYLAYLPKKLKPTQSPNSGGLLQWKDLSWVCDPNNQEVVWNIPQFLPPMIKNEPPQEYKEDTEGNKKIFISPLSDR